MPKSPEKARYPSSQGQKIVKGASLIILTFQTTALVLLMRYTRLHRDNDRLYLTSTAVFCSEVTKVVACVIAIYVGSGFSLTETLSEIKTKVVDEPVELLKLAIPSGLYTLQNNLLYVALSNLDAATYQITYQLKIFTTAIFMVVMLNKRISVQQWVSLGILLFGVAFVQLAPTSGNGSTSVSKEAQNPILGLIAVITASLSSGFAGVYFEKLMKDTAPSLWVRNIQLGFWGSVLALVGVYLTDHQAVAQYGFFQGYNFNVILVIGLQSFGGLCIAVVIKYADNILKVFATSISIILSCVASYYLLGDFVPNWYFVLGSVAVLSATILYGFPLCPAPPLLPVSRN
ncbi:hypothetical protein AAHC03_013620 [Spirometra sp. Aus1]